MTPTQKNNIAWVLPRPKKDHYKGGMPLYAEEWLIKLANRELGFKGKLLNLFCGMNKYGFRVDIKPDVKPDLVCDVHELTAYHNEKYDIIMADPPYSNQEAKEIYNTPKLHYKIWSHEADKLLNIGGLFIIYHKYMMPNPAPEKYRILNRVFIGTRTYHVPRVALIFRKELEK